MTKTRREKHKPTLNLPTFSKVDTNSSKKYAYIAENEAKTS